MKPSKRTQRKPAKKTVSTVNPKELIDKYLLTRSPMVEQDIMRALFILYCAKKGISLKFTDKILVADPDNQDPLYRRLRNAATGGREDHQFVEYLHTMYDKLSGPGKSILGKSYVDLVKSVVMN